MADSAEEILLDDAAKELRRRDKQISKKYPFDSRVTFFDADELSLLMKTHQIKHAIFIRDDGWRFAVGDNAHKELFTVKPYQIVELMFLPADAVKLFMETGKVFESSEMLTLVQPGINEMKNYCTELSETISDAAVGLKKKKVGRIFEKLWKMLGADVGGDKDYLARRIKYFKDVSELYFQDKVVWHPEMKSLRLVR